MEKKKVVYKDKEGSFEVTLPASWQTEKDGEGGLLLFTEEGNGLLHLMPFARDPNDQEDVDAGEELFAFLAEQEIELNEDEVEDVELAGGVMALCEYAEENGDDEDDDGEEEVFWLVGVVVGADQIIFASYSCPLGEEEAESVLAREILGSLVLKPVEGGRAPE
jgi:hypothetical protein